MLPIPAPEEVKAAWRHALQMAGVKVTIERRPPNAPVVRDTEVRAQYGIGQAAMEMPGPVEQVNHRLTVYADDLKNLGDLRTGDKVIFAGRTATVGKPDNTSGRVQGVPIVFYAVVTQG